MVDENDYNYYMEQYRTLAKLKEELIQSRLSFFQHILILSVSMLAILVAFRPALSANPHIRLVFVLGVLLLLSGILTVGIVVRNYANLITQKVQTFQNELEKALDEERKLKPVFGGKMKKTTLWCEKYSLWILFMSLITLFAYTVLINAF